MFSFLQLRNFGLIPARADWWSSLDTTPWGKVYKDSKSKLVYPENLQLIKSHIICFWLMWGVIWNLLRMGKALGLCVWNESLLIVPRALGGSPKSVSVLNFRSWNAALCSTICPKCSRQRGNVPVPPTSLYRGTYSPCWGHFTCVTPAVGISQWALTLLIYYIYYNYYNNLLNLSLL